MTCRQMQIGVSAHQKLDKLSGIVRCMGYQTLPVFGDCFDEVTYLDPVLYPEAMKAFANSVRLPRPCLVMLQALSAALPQLGMKC